MDALTRYLLRQTIMFLSAATQELALLILTTEQLLMHQIQKCSHSQVSWRIFGYLHDQTA